MKVNYLPLPTPPPPHEDLIVSWPELDLRCDKTHLTDRPPNLMSDRITEKSLFPRAWRPTTESKDWEQNLHFLHVILESTATTERFYCGL